MPDNGVKLALAAAAKEKPDDTPYRTIADLLAKNGDPISVEAIYNFEKKGYFPPERAKVIAAHYDIPPSKLVNPKFGQLFDQA